MGPSELAPFNGKIGPFDGCRSMVHHNIDTIVDAFTQAAKHAQEVGFDSVQLHGSHGSLLSQFLSGVYNKRTDDYGGSVENRARIVLEAYNAVRNSVGKDYPVTIKLNTTDYNEQGVTGDDFLKVATMLEKAGMDAIELSGGIGWNLYMYGDINRTFARTVKEEAYYRDVATQAKQRLTIPTILTGGVRSYEVAKQIVTEGIADYIGLCRPLIREPNLVNRWKFGDTSKSSCVSDNACMFAVMNSQVLHCVHLKTRTS
jgi:2,4-dienoyl-CoA reductase-like NADH-dependent reductase (Old Yellow Enzyme family)